MRVKKRHFTLLEILIVFLILASASVVVGIKLNEAYKEQRFTSQSQQVLNQLTFAQDLMLLLDADVIIYFDIEPSTHHLICHLEVDKPLKEHLSRLFEKKIQLTGIRGYLFDGKYQEPLALYFSLGAMSKGVLTLFEGESQSQRQCHIELPGYPAPLKFSSQNHLSDLVDYSVLYPQEVYEELYEKKTSR